MFVAGRVFQSSVSACATVQDQSNATAQAMAPKAP